LTRPLPTRPSSARRGPALLAAAFAVGLLLRLPAPAHALPQPDEISEEITDELPDLPGEEGGPVYAQWWFWLAISTVLLGVTTAIIVDVTTDDPRPSDPMEPSMSAMGLSLRF
jgi:hypothetical protein